MAKTQIKQPFGPWDVTLNGRSLKRSGVNSYYVDVSSFGVDTAKAGTIYVGTSLGDAVTWVDKHIADFYEVEKPLDERLKDAEAEIVTLKSRVKELEGSRPKFRMGQKVKRIKFDGMGKVINIDTCDGHPVYALNYAGGWYGEHELEAV